MCATFINYDNTDKRIRSIRKSHDECFGIDQLTLTEQDIEKLSLLI